MKPTDITTIKVDRTGLTDTEYIQALELSNRTMADEVFRLRQLVLSYWGKID